ncbi:MAG: dipeptide ABC transporter ATP-binding protein [Alphaproteobacteria bacterium]|nr:dipeptide ABC transporter ATP-binding protein [Alphaproteobacteria bacterium]
MSLLSVERLRVAFAGREVVHGLEFRIEPEEKLALVGESGSGKSVSALSLLRLAQGAVVSGRALWQGEDLLRMDLQRLRGVRGGEIAMIFQEPMTALNPLFCVGDQIAEVLELKLGMSRQQAWREAVQWLERTGLPDAAIKALHFPHQLSGGQRQRAMIAMALAGRPKLLLADEPTTALDVSLRGQIMELLRESQARYGLAVMLITHDLPMVRQFAQRVLVMEKGHCVEQGEVSRVLSHPGHPYTQKLVNSLPVRDVRTEGEDDVLARAHQLTVDYPVKQSGWRGWFRTGRFRALDGIDFEVRRGQTLGVVGESGSGKSTLALSLLGLLSSSGHLSLWGQAWCGKLAVDLTLRRRIQVVFQDPFSSLSPRMTVGEIVQEGLNVHHPDLGPEVRQSRVLTALQEVGLTETEFPGLLQRYPHEFSGGQRQRLAIARALVVEPEVLVLDEPTSALDVSIQCQILELLQELQKRKGLAYVLITHDLAVVRAMAHRVLVLRHGRVIEHGPATQVLEHPEDPYTQALVSASFPA